MEVSFAALSIHKFVNSVGADAGFAAFVCVAVIGLLYFAQARETASLRERLEDTHERIAGMEARIAQLIHLQSTRSPAMPGSPTPPPTRVTPPPVAARPMGSAIASVRRVPAAAAAGAVNGILPAAPIGTAAPALASATKLIPSPPVPAAAPRLSQDTAVVPGAGGPANGNGDAAVAGPATAVGAAATGAGATSAGAAGAGATGAGGAPAGAGAGRGPTPPRVQIGSDSAAAGGPAAAAGAAAPGSRRTVTVGNRPLGEARFDAFEPSRRGLRGRFAGRGVPLLVAFVAVAVIAVGAVVITSNGGSTASSTGGHGSGASTTASGSGSGKGAKHKATPFVPSKVTVAVLNGTNVGGLAADVSKVLTGAGYKKGSVTNAASQTEKSTVVYYMPSYQVAAGHVATKLKLSSAAVHLATRTVIQSCATSPTSSTATSCSGDVIVSVGSDRASLAAAGTSAAG